MLWFEITATVAPGDVEAVAEIMREVAPGGVSVEEPVDALGPEMGFRVRTGEPVAVRAYVPSSELGAILTERLRVRMHDAFPAVELIAKPLYEQDWAVAWREFFGAVDVGGRVVVIPTWVEHTPRPDQVAITLDPGQAFGTGHHETTRLCLAALDEEVRPGVAVLDVGTGSGILAIAAVKLGAARVYAVDIDPVAAEVARENIATNGVADAVEVAAGALPEDHGGRYGLVVANISTAANLGLRDLFARVVAPGGTLILSGILAADAVRVSEAMSGVGFARRRVSVEGDWCSLVFGA